MLNKDKEKELKIFAEKIRLNALRSIGSIGVGHVGGSLSVCDLLAVLYNGVMKYDPKNPKWEGRDYLVMSKGHSGPGLYATLAMKGFFPVDMLDTLNQFGTNLTSHCDMHKTPGVDCTTGSLGQGSSMAAGMALGLKKNGLPNYVYLVLGDGEIQEGQVWEMALFAAHQKLDNLIAFVDYNKQQLDGYTKDINDLGDIAAKYEEFGWFAQNIDGHNVTEINDAIEKAQQNKGKPSMIVLNTIKGKGWSGSEGILKNHSMTFLKEDFEKASAEISAKIAGLEKA